jgi:arginine-tRNA-protein transferase
MGRYLYRTQCPACRACEAIRVPVAEFTAVRTHKRTLRRGDELLQVRVGPPQCDQARVDLFNLHKRGRGLALTDGELDLDGYFGFLVDSCAKTLELSYWSGEQLVAVGISDRGLKTLNAVYCYYDPSFDRLSLGTYNVLKQIELCRSWQLDYLYLGLYIAASPRMNYKARFLPHERLVDGIWRKFERS